MKNEVIKKIEIEGMTTTDLLAEFGKMLDARLSNFVPSNENKAETVEYLTREQVGKLLQVSMVTVWKWSKDGLLTSYRIGNKVRYLKSEVMTSAKAIQQHKKV